MPVSYSPVLNVSDSPSKGPSERFFVGGGGASAWSPAELFTGSEVGDYWDFTDSSTLFQDAAKTTAVSSGGDPVGAAVGQNGSIDLSQTSASNRPAWNNASTGKYGLDCYNAVLSWLEGSATSIGGDVTVAARLSIYNADARVPVDIYADASNHFRLLSPAGSATIRSYTEIGGTIDFTATQSLSLDTESTVFGTHDTSGPTLGIDLDGNTASISTVAGASFGTSLKVGRNSDSGVQFWYGHIYRLVVINRILTAEEKTSLASWLESAA